MTGLTEYHDLDTLNNALRKEADDLLGGLRDILEEFGRLHIVGSYVTGLMTWRDLDIFLEVSDISEDEFFSLGRLLAHRLSPFKMFYTNHSKGASEHGFAGMYWGIRLGDVRSGAWKIDLHAESAERCRDAVQSSESLRKRLDEETRRRILLIKSQVWSHPEYRKRMTSHDIYEAVLSEGITTREQFLARMGIDDDAAEANVR